MNAKHKSMKTSILMNDFGIAVPNLNGWMPRRGRICQALWQALSGSAVFDAFDDRIQELCWAYLFATAGLTLAVRRPEGLVFQIAFDAPTGPTTFRVMASKAPDQRTLSFSEFGAPA
jgi:hypothetical protein